MKMLIKSLFIGLIITILSCSKQGQIIDASTQISTSEESSSKNVIANRVLKLEIDGMVCKMGCGGSIRKELKNSDAVTKVEFDFAEERETNFATVYFDKNMVTADQIISSIANVNNGQFTVRTIGSEAFIAEKATDSNPAKIIEEKPVVEAYSTGFEVPNIFELITEYLI